MKYHFKHLAELHTAVFLFGMAGLFGKLLLLSPAIIVLGRVFFATVFLFFILFFFRHPILLKQRTDYLRLALLGILLSVHWITFFKSIQLSTVAIGLLTFSTFPVFTTLLEPLFFKEKLLIKDIIVALSAVSAITLIIPEFDFRNSYFQGVMWGIISGFTFALLSISNRNYVQKYSGILIAFYQDLFATILLLPFLFISSVSFDMNDLLLVLFLGVLCTGVAHTLFINGLSSIRAQTASIINCLEPVYGIIAALLLLDEVPEFRTVIGGVIIISLALFVSIKQEPA